MFTPTEAVRQSSAGRVGSGCPFGNAYYYEGPAPASGPGRSRAGCAAGESCGRSRRPYQLHHHPGRRTVCIECSEFSCSLFWSEIGGKPRLEVLCNEGRAELSVAFRERNDDVEKLLEQIKKRALLIPELGVLAVPLGRGTAALVTEPRYTYGAIVAAKLLTASSFQEELEPGDVILGI